MPYGLPNVSFIGYPLPMPCAAHCGLGFRTGLPADAPLVLDHFLRLSPLDRRHRFCATLTEAALARHVAEMWERTSFVLLAQDGPLWSAPPFRAGPARALAEIAIDGAEAEIGVSVDEHCRGRGLGGWLTRTAAFLLAPRGVTRLRAWTMAGNTSMTALGRSNGARITTEEGETEIVFEVAALRRAYLRRRAPLLFREAV
jgi:GNAT superfamily N-acetyltransferase